jgi:hypothetical protein
MVNQRGRSLLKRDAIVLVVFALDVWAIGLTRSKHQCRRDGGEPVVSDATVVCIRPDGVPGGFAPAVAEGRGRG